jgi:hypothetical protein
LRFLGHARKLGAATLTATGPRIQTVPLPRAARRGGMPRRPGRTAAARGLEKKKRGRQRVSVARRTSPPRVGHEIFPSRSARFDTGGAQARPADPIYNRNAPLSLSIWHALRSWIPTGFRVRALPDGGPRMRLPSFRRSAAPSPTAS